MCWKLQGKPQNLKQTGSKGGNQPTRLGQANHTAIVEERSAQLGFNKSDLENLKHLLNQLEDSNANPSSNSGSCSMAQLGTKASISFQNNFNTLIIDSGASNHMTSMYNFFSSYLPCSRKQKIRVADGSFSSVVGQGFVYISPSLTLRSVLHVPNLNYNLLSIGKITKELNCSIEFTPTGCYF